MFIIISLNHILSIAVKKNDPFDAVVTKQYKENLRMFRKTAKHWTYIFATNHTDSESNTSAGQQCAEYESKIKSLMELSQIDEHEALVTLSSNNWDLESLKY